MNIIEKNIGFDLDNTLVDVQKWVYVILYKHKIDIASVKDWGFSNIPSYVKDEIYDYFRSEKMNEVDFYPGVISLLQDLSLYNNLFIVSARCKEIRKGTINLIEEKLPKVFEGIYFTNWTDTKEEYFNNLKLDYWFDDNSKDCLISKNLGINTILISNEDTAYNHEFRKDFEWYSSVYDYFKGV